MSGLSVVNVRVVCYGCPGYVLWMSRLCVENVRVMCRECPSCDEVDICGYLWIS